MPQPQPPRVHIRSVPMPELNQTGYEIIGDTADDVQREITRLMNYVDDRGGEAHFNNPAREGARWRSAGYTRLTDTVLA